MTKVTLGTSFTVLNATVLGKGTLCRDYVCMWQSYASFRGIVITVPTVASLHTLVKHN